MKRIQDTKRNANSQGGISALCTKPSIWTGSGDYILLWLLKGAKFHGICLPQNFPPKHTLQIILYHSFSTKMNYMLIPKHTLVRQGQHHRSNQLLHLRYPTTHTCPVQSFSLPSPSCCWAWGAHNSLQPPPCPLANGQTLHIIKPWPCVTTQSGPHQSWKLGRPWSVMFLNPPSCSTLLNYGCLRVPTPNGSELHPLPHSCFLILPSA